MNYPQFYVTYCVMNTDAGANPFGHSCIIFSIQEEENKPIKVQDCVGFYSQPSTTTDPIIKALKELLGLKIDMQDGHGILQQEKMHQIDGKGMQGRSFKVEKDKFYVLKTQCEKQIQAEAEAKNDLDTKLQEKGCEPNGHTRFIEEKALAALENRPSRLHPFHVQMDITSYGFDSSSSHTCKTRALNLLQNTGIIDAEIRAQLEGGLASRAFPRFSAETLSPFRLVSLGEPERVESRKSARIFYNRQWQRNSLFFASPLNLYQTTPSEIQEPNNVYERVQFILNNARTLENTLRHAIKNTQTPDRQTNLQEQLIRVQGLYNDFQNVHQNCLPDYLSAKQLFAEKCLNIATLSLSPDRVNYSFALRAFESISMRHALLGVIGMLLSAVLFSGAIGVALFTGAAIYTTYHLYEFYKEEATFAKMIRDYLGYQETKARPEIPPQGADSMPNAVDTQQMQMAF